MNPQVKTRKKPSATDARNLRTLLLLSVFEPHDIGARIATARKQAGLTQEELGDAIEVSTRSLQGYEAGDVVPYKHLGKISEVTGRPVGWLLHGDDAGDGPTQGERLGRIEAQLEEIRRLLVAPDEGADTDSGV